MKKRLDNNGGFTLVELIIAIAILALLMTAVCGLMGVQIVSFNKTKADITVQNSAQETYDLITDSVMQAKNIKLQGYTITSGNAIEFDTTNIGASVTGTSVSSIDCLKTSEIEALPDTERSSKTDYLTLGSTQDVYVSKMTIEYAVKMDINYVPVAKQPAASALEVDICTVTIQFKDNSMYVAKDYEYMDDLDDRPSDMDDLATSTYQYTSSLNYVELPDGTTITGAVATIDAENNAMGINLMFADNSMSYTTRGMINIRNSYVLKDAK